MAVIISGNGIDMGNNPVSNASQIDGTVINENGDNVATLVEANSYDLGVGQTWQNVTASRSLGVTYTNTTGKPIFISIMSVNTSLGTYGAEIKVDGISVSSSVNDGTATSGFTTNASAVVPNNSTYRAFKSGGATQNNTWLELR